jgi:hypothetical protein
MKSDYKKRMDSSNPPDPNMKKGKTVAFKNNSLMPTTMLTDFADNED